MNYLFGIILSCAALTLSGPTATAATRPNLIIVLLDDLGYGDLACYGNPHLSTPHIYALAAAGTRFTQAYAAGPVC